MAGIPRSNERYLMGEGHAQKVKINENLITGQKLVKIKQDVTRGG